jgi:hypothetical protein
MEPLLGLVALGIAAVLFIAANVVALALMIGGREPASRERHR